MAQRLMARDNRAVYARRNAAAKALGYRNYADQRARRAKNMPRAGDVRAAPRPVKVTAGGQTITKTVGRRASNYSMQAIEAAAARGRRVVITATFTDSRGNPKTRKIDRLPDGTIGGAGGGGIVGGTPLGAIQITEGDQGIDARKLRRFIRDYYDDAVWDALYDLWEFDY